MGQEEHNLLDPAALLAQELYKLSFQEREQASSDVHGVSDVVEETPEFVAERLAELESALASIAGDSKPASMDNKNKSLYNVAKEQDENYFKALDFQLKFLRADNFNSVKAAARMIKYLEAKQKLFGPNKLTQNITLDDFSAEDVKVARSGLGSLLPLRDRAGRLVLCWMTQLRGNSSFLSRMRLIFYLFAIASDDEVTQKKGFILVVFNVGPNKVGDPYAATLIIPLIETMAVKVASVHYCYEPADLMEQTMSAFINNTESQTRARFRIHCGDCKELHYQLMTFGIPTQLLPISDQCEYNFEHVQLFLADSRRKKEGSSSPTSNSNPNPKSNNNSALMMMIPGSSDVLIGRGKVAQTHIGNVRYLHLIDTHMERYEASAERGDKKKIANEVTKLVKQSGGRFLDCSDATSDQWYEVQDEIAVEKACTAFRSRRKLAMRAKQTTKAVPKQKRGEEHNTAMSPIESKLSTSFLENSSMADNLGNNERVSPGFPSEDKMSGHTAIGRADIKRHKVERTCLIEDDWIYSDGIEASEL